VAKYKVPMPNQNATDTEIREYIAYFKWADANIQPRGKTQPQPALPGSAKAPGETASAPRPPGQGEPK
jgi:nitrite reductase (NO-forming)